ncbi:MAG TPA: SDR family oxidoreductase [Nitrospiraceae bacterium]|nr:SDR family oxidoreductase [Nitrospiraceae bacterium]
MEAQTNPRPFAIVTGASRGIGAEYARALAARGFDLLLISRDMDRMNQLASELTGRHQASVDIEPMDLALPEAAHRLYIAARQRRSTVDLLVNNAGFGLFGEFVEMPMARIQEMLRLHVNTVVESIRLFLPGMVKRRSGQIINVASIAGLFSVPYLAEYAATKAFLITLSEALAEEVRPFGVYIQVCCPGSTDTDFHATAGFRPKNPLGMQSPAEVVAASLGALKRGPALVTIGWRGRVVSWLSRYVPRTMLARAAGARMKSTG